MGSHSVTCHPAEVTFPPLPQPIKAGTRIKWSGRMHGWVDLVGLVTYRCSISAQRWSPIPVHTHTHTHNRLLLFWNLSGTTRVSRYQKGKTRKVKTNLDLLEQEIVSCSGICWAICKSAPHPRQPHQHPTTRFFYRPDALPAAQPHSCDDWRYHYAKLPVMLHGTPYVV